MLFGRFTNRVPLGSGEPDRALKAWLAHRDSQPPFESGAIVAAASRQICAGTGPPERPAGPIIVVAVSNGARNAAKLVRHSPDPIAKQSCDAKRAHGKIDARYQTVAPSPETGTPSQHAPAYRSVLERSPARSWPPRRPLHRRCVRCDNLHARTTELVVLFSVATSS